MTDDYTLPIAKTGEQQFACIIRNRSGISAGEIDMAARFIDDLCDGDQQDAIEAAYSIYLKWCRETGKRSNRDASTAELAPVTSDEALRIFREAQGWKPYTVGAFVAYRHELAKLINYIRRRRDGLVQEPTAQRKEP